MSAIVNARDVLLQAAATRFETPELVGTVDFSNVTGATRPSNNADVTQTAVNAGVVATSGGLTLSAGGAVKGGKTDYGSGTGFFLGYSAGAYKFDIGSASSYLRWTGTALSLIGDITGTSNIDISGTADFDGQTDTGGSYYASRANMSLNSNSGGFYGRGHGIVSGVYGSSQGNLSGGPGGVQGGSDTGVGVVGQVNGTNGCGVYARGPVDGHAFKMDGPGYSFNSTMVPNFNADLLDGYHAGNSSGQVPVSNGTVNTNLNADLLDGNHAAAFSLSGHNHSGVYLPVADTAAAAAQVSNSGHTYTFSGGSVTGASVATFSGVKPGAATTNGWLLMVIDGSNFYIPIWT